MFLHWKERSIGSGLHLTCSHIHSTGESPRGGRTLLLHGCGACKLSKKKQLGASGPDTDPSPACTATPLGGGATDFQSPRAVAARASCQRNPSTPVRGEPRPGLRKHNIGAALGCLGEHSTWNPEGHPGSSPASRRLSWSPCLLPARHLPGPRLACCGKQGRGAGEGAAPSRGRGPCGPSQPTPNAGFAPFRVQSSDLGGKNDKYAGA